MRKVENSTLNFLRPQWEEKRGRILEICCADHHKVGEKKRRRWWRKIRRWWW